MSAMAKKIYRALVSCIAVVLGLTFVESPGASAIHNQHRYAVSRRHRAARQRLKAQRKAGWRRDAISYVCPMHPDIRSNSRGKCPKCLMDLVAEKPEAKVAQR